MCNSYSNGLCLYYGVSIKEMNNKCDRGDCVNLEKLWEKKIIEQLESHPLLESKFIPKYRLFPKICKRMNWGKREYISKFSNTGATIKLKRMCDYDT